MACAAFTIRFRNTWLSSLILQVTCGSESKRVSTVAMYLYSLVATISVVSMARLMSAALCSLASGCANSFIARTMPATRPTPSSVRSKAFGTSTPRNSRSAAASMLAHALENFGDRRIVGQRVEGAAIRAQQLFQIADRRLQEVHAVADVLDRRVDLVRDAGGEAADRLELARQVQLEPHPLALLHLAVEAVLQLALVLLLFQPPA